MEGLITRLRNTLLSRAPSRIEWAAGGVVWSQDSEGLKLAIVYRACDKGEPSLPEGKIRCGEAFEEAARRGVKEETGRESLLLNLLAVESYEYKNTHKSVLYWNMKAVDESSFTRSEEVERVDWLTVEEAMKTLRREGEKQVVDKAHRTLLAGRKVRLLPKLQYHLREHFGSARHERLDGHLRSLEAELQRRFYSDVASGEPIPAWFSAATHMTVAAAEAVQQGLLDKAWRFFHTASRIEIFGLTDAEVQLRAAVLRFEAEKLNKWRKRATEELIGTEKKPLKVNAAQLYEAAFIRDEHYNNQGYKDRLMKRHILTLGFILFAVLGLVLWYIADYSGDAKPRDAYDFSHFLGAALFGLLGATFSATLRVEKTAEASRIPEIVGGFRVTFLRIFMGAASAVIIYVALRSGIVSSIFTSEPNNKHQLTDPSPQIVYLFSFAAGFTERLVVRAVEAIAGKEK